MSTACNRRIPDIIPYQMPNCEESSINVASWEIDPNRCLLLVHDMQKYFVEKFPAGQPPVTELVSNVAQLLVRCRKLRVPVVYTAQPGGMSPDERGLLKDFWGAGMTTDPLQREIVSDLASRDNDKVFTKWRYSAFHKSNLLQHMRDLQRDQIIICGLYAHIGCLMTANEAFANDIEAFFVTDGTAAFTIDDHRLAIQYAARFCAVVLDTAKALSMLAPEA